MVADAAIREQGYVYFVSESRDLLRTIEAELFLLREDPDPQRIHSLMRATHTLKGASANVGLEMIQTIAHHLEDIFRTLFDPEATVDVELESLLVEAYECLRLALMGELDQDHDRDDEVMATAVNVFAKIQERLGDCFGRDVPIPSSSELGFDIVQSIFESGVQERIEELEQLLEAEDGDGVAELIAVQSEVFVGLGESLGLPGFSALATGMVTALEVNGDRPLVVGAAALEDLKAAHQAVLGGDREVGGEVMALKNLLAAAPSGSSDSAGDEGETEEVLDLGDWDTGEFLDLTGTQDSQEELGETAVAPPEEMISVVASAVEKAAAKVSRPVARSGNKLIRVELERLQELQHLVGELLIQQNRQSLQDEQLQASLKSFRTRLQKHRRLLGELRDRTRALGLTHDALGAKGDPLERLGKGRRGLTAQSLAAQSLADLMDATVAEAEHLEDTVEVVERYSQQTTETTDKQRRLLGSVRDSLMDTRMQPISTVFQRFPPLVRQMVGRYGKSVELRLLGERVAIDKTAIEELYDPLLHLVRNAFDHGIESVAERRAAGKAETGIIQLQALQQGNQVLIIVSDDGGGIDPERVRHKAQARQLRDSAALAQMKSAELFELLFEPGFSTTEQVSDLSGRGVGLDVVKSQMRALKGSVSVQSILGRGTAFILRVPLGLMTARLLVCHADRAVYGFLSDSISQILIPQPEQTHILGGQRVLRWQQGGDPEITLPVRKLSDLVRYGSMPPGRLLPDIPSLTPVLHNNLAPLMLLRGDEGLVAIEVDGVVGEQELVLRQLSEAIPSPSYIYGCTILGDGRMALVLDGAALLERSDVAPAAITPEHIVQTALNPRPTANPDATALPAIAEDEDDEPSMINSPADISADISADIPAPTQTPIAPAPKPAIAPPMESAPVQSADQPTLLVVEDSETERNILALTLEKAGFLVVQAGDGQAALEQLRSHPNVRLVISDLEMPRMGGLEFLSARRQEPAIAKVPVMMLTSCSGKQYQQIATSLGAAQYMTKPHVTQELINNINALIAGP